MWRLHNLAQAYGQRPSGIVGIGDSWTAYQFDLACLMVGRWVENRLAERDRKGRPVWTVEQLLDDRRGTGGGRFRSPRALVRRRVRVSERGVW